MSETREQYILPLTFQAIKISPPLAETYYARLLEATTYAGIPFTVDPSVPVDELWLIAKTEDGGIATLVYNIGSGEPPPLT